MPEASEGKALGGEVTWAQGPRPTAWPGSGYLLEVGSKAVQVLVIGQHGVRLTPKAVDVPYAQQSQQHGGVLLQGRRAEVLVLQGEQGGGG